MPKQYKAKKLNKEEVCFEKMLISLFAIKFCVSDNIISNEKRKKKKKLFRNLPYFKKNFRFVDFLKNQIKLSERFLT